MATTAAVVGGGGVAKASPATRRLFPIVEGASELPAAGSTISIAQFNILGRFVWHLISCLSTLWLLTFDLREAISLLRPTSPT